MEGTSLSPISEEPENVPATPPSAGVVTTTISSSGADAEAEMVANLRAAGFDIPLPGTSRSSNQEQKRPKHKKSKAIIAAFKKTSSSFFDSFKSTERLSTSISSQPSDLNDTFALLYGTGAHPQEYKVQEAIFEIRKLQERGVEWWNEVTRKDQKAIIHKDSFTDLERAFQNAQGRPSRFVDNQGDDGSDEVEHLFFRCDVNAVDATDFAAAEAECKQLVIEAGGKILDYEYVGGFLYSLPATADQLNPLADGDETLLGGHISITSWKPFHPDQAEPNKAQGARGDAEEGEVQLGARILDAGVELANMDPGRQMTGAPEVAELGNDEEGSGSDGVEEEPVEYGVARVVDLRGAVRGRAQMVHVSRGFGEEMRRVEGLYRNWVPSMGRGRRE